MDDPRMMAEDIARQTAGVKILMMMRNMGDQMPENMAKMMEMLGVKRAAPPTNQPLPRHGGMDERGNPIIIPPEGRFYK